MSESALDRERKAHQQTKDVQFRAEAREGRSSMSDVEIGRKTLSIRIPADLHADLFAAAAERDVSVTFLAVRALRDFLPRLLPVDEVQWVRPESES